MQFAVVLLFALVHFSIASVFVPASSSSFQYYGRWDHTVAQEPRADWSGVSVAASFTGTTSVNVTFASIAGTSNCVNITVRTTAGIVQTVMFNMTADTWVSKELAQHTTYTITIVKRTEANQGVLTFAGLTLTNGGSMAAPPVAPARRIEFIGDSITCGFGNLGHTPCDFSPYTEDETRAWGWLVAQSLAADVHVEAWSGKGVIRNCCNWPNYTSPDPLPSYYGKTLASVDKTHTWDFASWVPQAIVINLGTNDYSTPPQPPQDLFVNAYISFIKSILQAYGSAAPQLFLACGPMIGDPCCSYVKDVADATRATFIDLQNILKYPDDYGCAGHPGVTGHEKMAAIATPIIQKAMNW